MEAAKHPNPQSSELKSIEEILYLTAVVLDIMSSQVSDLRKKESEEAEDE